MGQFFVAAPAYGAETPPNLHLAYPMLLADALARYRRVRGDTVLFSAGSNESSQQLAAAGAREDLAPLSFAERLADQHAAVWSGLSVAPDRLVRTSHPVHHDVVQGMIARLFRMGDVYWGSMRGHFCLSCEVLLDEAEVADGGRCPNPECGREVQWIDTQTYLMRTGQYQDRVRDHLRSQPKWIQPADWAERALQVCATQRPEPYAARISNWGVLTPPQLPRASGMRVSVWVDVLTNYLTAAWYLQHEDVFRAHWPPDLQVVTQDLNGEQHLWLYPSLLLSQGVDLPRQMMAVALPGTAGPDSPNRRTHPLAVAGALSRLAKCEQPLAADALRWFTLHELCDRGSQGFTMASFVTCYNRDLSGRLSRLAYRVMDMLHGIARGRALPPGAFRPPVDQWISEAWRRVTGAYDASSVKEASDAVMELLERLNQHLDQRAPWADRKRKSKTAAIVISEVAEALAKALVMVAPVMPEAAERLGRDLGMVRAPRECGEWWGEVRPCLVLRGARLRRPETIYPPVSSQARLPSRQEIEVADRVAVAGR